MTERFIVQVDADQFDRLARPTQPLAAVAELIWNALDAEALTVTVTIGRTDLEAVDTVSVNDDGHGMTNADALRDFKRLGGSWKKSRTMSKNGKRPLHGREGAGRFRAFAIGSTVQWISIAENIPGELERTSISGSLDSSEFVVGDPESLATGTTGTVVRIERPREYANRLLAPTAPTSLLTRFAVYLVKYPSVSITYDGRVLDPNAIVSSTTDIALDSALGGEYGTPLLRILEWQPQDKEMNITPSLVLCDENGVALSEITDRIDAPPSLPYSAYLMWAGFPHYANDLLLADMAHETLTPIIEAARQAIGRHLDTRLKERRIAVIDRWKAERVYPYAGDAKTPTEAQERRIFDVVAVAASSAVAQEPKAARLSLRLIKEALGQPPGALHRVLKEVLDLTPSQLADFDKLLDRTSLASIIYTSKMVTDRLDFVNDLEAMLFDPGKKQRLREREQLHRILANGRVWIFGEQYTLAVDDKGLTQVLQAHRHILGDPEVVSTPVTDTEGHTRIIDLMLSKATHFADRRQHLVVELKRPSLRLTQKELAQITNYAVAVRKDERFKTPEVSWEFWLIGDDMDESVEELVNRKNAPSGLYTEGDGYRIWVRRWAEVLEENRQRLHFYREHLEYEPEETSELQNMINKYLHPRMRLRKLARSASQPRSGNLPSSPSGARPRRATASVRGARRETWPSMIRGRSKASAQNGRLPTARASVCPRT